MNVKRLLLAIIVGFVFLFASDFLIHAVLMVNDYTATMSLWRPDADMQSRLPLMNAAQLMAVVTFVLLWALWFADQATFGRAIIFGILMGLFNQVNTLANYVVMPLPERIALKWFVGSLAQTTILAILTYLLYRPRPRVSFP